MVRLERMKQKRELKQRRSKAKEEGERGGKKEMKLEVRKIQNTRE